MAMIANFTWETRWLGLRTLRRFYRVPANPFSIVLFPLIQLFVFSQLFKDIVQLPGFGGGGHYLAYLAPGQIAFTVFFRRLLVRREPPVRLPQRLPRQVADRADQSVRILAGEFVPLFVECMVMAAIILLLSVLLGAPIATGLPGAAIRSPSSAERSAWPGPGRRSCPR